MDVFCAKPRGTFYLFPNISKYGIIDADDIIEFFVKEAKVLIRAEYGPVNSPGHFRISVCAPWHRLAIGLEKIANALETIKK